MARNSRAETATTPMNSSVPSATTRQSSTSRTRRSKRPQCACTAQLGGPSTETAAAIATVRSLPGGTSVSVITSRKPRAQAVKARIWAANASDTVRTPATTMRNSPSTMTCRSSRRLR